MYFRGVEKKYEKHHYITRTIEREKKISPFQSTRAMQFNYIKSAFFTSPKKKRKKKREEK